MTTTITEPHVHAPFPPGPYETDWARIDRIATGPGPVADPDEEVDHFEQVQGNSGMSWARDEVMELTASMTAAFRHGAGTADREQVTLRDAASMVAVGRVAEAGRLNGWV